MWGSPKIYGALLEPGFGFSRFSAPENTHHHSITIITMRRNTFGRNKNQGTKNTECRGPQKNHPAKSPFWEKDMIGHATQNTPNPSNQFVFFEHRWNQRWVWGVQKSFGNNPIMSIMNLQTAPGSPVARHSSTVAECDSPATRFFPHSLCVRDLGSGANH